MISIRKQLQSGVAIDAIKGGEASIWVGEALSSCQRSLLNRLKYVARWSHCPFLHLMAYMFCCWKQKVSPRKSPTIRRRHWLTSNNTINIKMVRRFMSNLFKIMNVKQERQFAAKQASISTKTFGQHFARPSHLSSHGCGHSIAGLIRLLRSWRCLTQYLLQHLSRLDVVEIDRIYWASAALGEWQLQIHQADILNLTSINWTDSVSDLRVVVTLHISTPLPFHLFASISLHQDMYYYRKRLLSVLLQRWIAAVWSFK